MKFIMNSENSTQDFSQTPQDFPETPQDPPRISHNMSSTGQEGSLVLNYVLSVLRENDDAKEQLYKMVRSNLKEYGLNIDPEPFLESLFGERNKRIALEDHELSLREIAENILLFYDDGFSTGQIAKTMNIYPNLVKNVLSEERKWRSEIKDESIKKAPFYLRLLHRLHLI